MGKQVILVRKDLKMRRGKEISQGAHASLKVFLDMIHENEANTKIENGTYKYSLEHKNKYIHEWITGKFKKVTVRVNSEEELLHYYNLAKDQGIPCSLIQDSGLTEFGGVSTYTTVAIGPEEDSIIDSITGQLELY